MTTTFLKLLANSTSTITFDDGSTISAAELAATGSRLATGLQGQGLRTGDRLAIWLDNGPAYLAAIAASAAGSFAAVNVNTRYSPTEAATLIARSGAAAVLTSRGNELPSHLLIITPDDLVELADSPPTNHPSSPDDSFLVFTTSGTTSKPKMVLHRQRSIVEHSVAVAPFFGYTPDTPMLIALPLCGVFGLNSFSSAIAGNSPIRLATGFDAATAAQLIEQERIVAMNGSDDMFHRLLQEPGDLSSLTICGYGAFNASLDDVAERAEARGIRLSGLYGMSEVQALLAYRGPHGPLETRRLAGGKLVSPQSEVRAVDPDSDAVVANGAEGELQLRGPSLFAGYLAEGGDAIDHMLTDNAFHDRWFSTGDLGTTEAADRFTFITRMGDVLRLGGFLVAPAEIEEAVLGFAGISDVQVVSAAGPSGTRPVAFVIGDEIDEGAVIAHCQSVLAKFKCPVRVISLDSFPVTDGPNGVKIQKAKLRELAQEALRA